MKEKTSIVISCLAGAIFSIGLLWLNSHPISFGIKSALQGIGTPIILKQEQYNKSKAYTDFIIGLLYEKKGETALAAQKFKSATQLDPEATLAKIHYGVMLANMGMQAKADRVLDEATALSDKRFSTRALAALIFVGQNRYDDAIRQLTLAHEENPEDAYVVSSLAEIYVVSNRLADAINSFRDLLALKPNSAITYFNLAIVESRLRRLEDAAGHLIKAIELDPNSLKAWVALGLIYEKLDNITLAVDAYEKAIQLAPIDPRVYHNLARLHIKQNDIPAALRQYEAALAYNPKDVVAALDAALLCAQLQKTEDAMRFLNIPVAHGVQHHKIYFMMGYVQSEAGVSSEAIKYYLQSLELNPNFAETYFYLGVLYDDNNDIDNAKQYLQKAIELDPWNAEAYNYLGFLLVETGADLNLAIEYIKKALKLEPRNASFADSLGWAYYKKGLYNQAVAQLEMAVAIDGGDIVIRQHLVDAYGKLGEKNKAMELINKDPSVKDQNLSVLGL